MAGDIGPGPLPKPYPCGINGRPIRQGPVVVLVDVSMAEVLAATYDKRRAIRGPADAQTGTAFASRRGRAAEAPGQTRAAHCRRASCAFLCMRSGRREHPGHAEG